MSADRKDVAQLFRTYGPLIYRRALRLLNNEAEAEEAMQDVFIKVMGAIDRFDEQQDVIHWLYRVTTNHCLNVIRGKKRRRAAMQAYRDAPRRQNSRVVDLTTLRSLLSRADPQLAMAAIYVHIDGMSHSEAAVHLKVSRRTVGNLVDRFNTWAQRQLEAK